MRMRHEILESEMYERQMEKYVREMEEYYRDGDKIENLRNYLECTYDDMEERCYVIEPCDGVPQYTCCSYCSPCETHKNYHKDKTILELLERFSRV